MINNSFRIMGIATTNFEDITPQGSQFQKYRMLVEIENSKGTFIMPIEAFGSNQRVNTQSNYQGHFICVEGYIDTRESNYNGKTYYNSTLNVLSIDVLDAKFKNMTMAGNPYQTQNGYKTPAKPRTQQSPQQQYVQQQKPQAQEVNPAQQSFMDIPIKDDDLPF